METESNIEILIDFIDTNDKIRDHAALGLLKELRRIDEVNHVDRVVDPNPPSNVQAGEGFLVGLLKAEVSFANFNKLIEYLRERISNKAIKIKIKAPNGAELELETYNQKDFELSMKQALIFLKSQD